MGRRDVVELVVLAAVWGASFLFMRVAAPELGPVPLIALRVGIAALVLVPVLAARGGLGQLRGRWIPVAVTGVINSALPFCLLAYATLSVTAGMTSVLNATSPLWGGLVAHLWLRDRLTPGRVLGLAVGFGGVVFLFWGRASFRPGGAGLAVAAALAATLSYGIAASYAKKRLGGVNPLAVAAGSQLAAAILLLPGAAVLWPAHPVSPRSWGAVAALGVVCTAFAYVLYFRLIANTGPARAIAVTFLIPPFAVLWGAVFLGEALTPRLVLGALIVLVGTALATGIVKLPARGLTAARRPAQ
ncbi:MAG TPA: DMT family transporter [Anaeromyxobacteraceae bacterium]|nr:DMT family transporter [Anaeromyxobacteraceae bacterium]